MDADIAELRAALIAVAERSVAIRTACTNEESTKLYLILPVLGALGYDYTNPHEVQPEFPADFRDEQSNRADFVVVRDGSPLIAIECKRVGTALEPERGQLGAYFAALRSVRLGILTDGVRFEFFVDCENQNVMDPEPFLTLDIDAIASGTATGETFEALAMLIKARFDPDTVAEAAEFQLVRRRIRTALIAEVREPSDDFCRLILQRVGLKHLRRSAIQARYGAVIRQGFEEAIIIPVVQALRATYGTAKSSGEAEDTPTQRNMTTDRELAVYRYVCRRLAFLASDEHQFTAIERVQYRDYLGKFAVFYENVRKGRLFDFIEGGNGYDKFVFPAPIGEIVTNTMADIDEPLRNVFTMRVREIGASEAFATARALAR